ncbi:MAG TPA: carboxypeptidase regulatory-like domain-containing protein [Vicinamibacterales bacterium]|nr:carboxypeptidase regulatory-like domain-containing protein [Vicinamibacterales bacterium]
MRRTLFGMLAVAVMLGWLAVPLAYAQATGTIAGLVTDESGAVLPGVTIEVTSGATGQTRSAISGADGFFSVPLLQPGPYAVKGTLQGFRTFIREGITVTVESTSRVDMKLTVGRLEESVTVKGESPLVETAHATLGIVVDEKKVVELPLNGRNFTQLGTLMPGVVAPPSALGGATGDATPGGFGAATAGFSVNGQRNQSNNFLLDGTSNNDTFNTGFVLRPPPDAIQEFKILTHSYSAEYGRNSGSVVNVVTRSGSNDLHGAAWEFNRDDSLQARNFFAPSTQPKPKLKQNQFGASLGGPIARNKLFGFGYYEGYRNTSGNTINIVVLTDAQRTGNFGSTTIRNPATGLPFTNNTIPTEQIDPAARRLIDEFVPRATDGNNRYIASPDSEDNRDQMGFRGDYQLTQNHSMLVRYLRSTTEAITPATTRPIGGVAKATLQDLMFSDTHIFGSGTINVARFSYNWIGANPAQTSGLSNADYGIQVPQNVPEAAGLANIVVTGFFSLGDAQQPFVDRKNKVFQFTDDFTWVRGRHSMKFGLDIREEKMFIAFVNRPNGDFTFSGSTSARTGNAAADFMLGLPAQFRRTTKNTSQDGKGWLYSAYAQDEFRPWARVTLNFGLRYELPIPFEDVNGALNAFRPGVQSQRFPTAPVGLVYPGDPGIPDGTYQTDKNNFAPRVGVVWDPTGTGRSSLRAAWGIFYDSLAGQGDFFQNGVLAPPFTPLLEVNAPPAALTLRTPLNSVSGGAVDFPPGLIFIGWGEDFNSPFAQHFNLTWQQQVGEMFAAEVGYVGSRGYHLPIFIEVNPGLYTAGQTAPSTRLFPAYSLVRPTFSVARSWYDSLQASFRMRPNHGINFLASYTLGHAVDHVSGLNIGGEQRPVLPVTIGDQASIDQALTFEKGDALFDVRHRFVVSFGAELPTPKDYGSLVEHLAGGWQVNGIVQAQTGFPTGVFDPVTDIRFLTNRPDAICDPNDNAPHTVDQWFNTACFVRRAVPDTGTRPGNAGRNTVRGPGFARTDLSLFKNIDLSGPHRVQVRIEAFNLFNQTRFGQPGNQISTANFGRIITSDDGRIMQLALKYSF